MSIDICDPVADLQTTQNEYGPDLIKNITGLRSDDYQAIVLAVAHDHFSFLPLRETPNQVIYDLKSALNKEVVDKRL